MASTEAPTTRYQALDLWRGAVCLFVVMEHAAVALWTGLEDGAGFDLGLRRALLAPFLTNVGTPLFFVISGYCIAASLVSHRRRGGAPGAFLARRMWRVFPPYWIALLGFAAFVSILDGTGLAHWHSGQYSLELPSVGDLGAAQWLGNVTLTETWRPLVWGGPLNVFTRVAWSLCYQEQFYLVCFLVLLATRNKSLFRTLAVASAVIIVVRVALQDSGRLALIDGTFPTLWHEFAIGLAAFWRLNRASGRLSRFGVDAGLAAVSGLGFWSGSNSLIAAPLFALGLIAFFRFDDAWSKIASLEPLRALGRCSYGVYLIHLPVVVVVSAALTDLGVTGFWARAAVTVPLATILSVAAGMAFSRYVESRFAELPSWLSNRPSVRSRSRAEGSASCFSTPSSGAMRVGSAG